MGLFNVRSSIEPAKLSKLILIEPSDKPLVLNRTTFNPDVAQPYSSNSLNLTRLFHMDKGVIGKETDIPSATLGRVYLADEINRHVFPTVVVLVPLDNRARSYAKTEIDFVSNRVSSDTNQFCLAAVAQAVVLVADRKLSEFEIVDQMQPVSVPTT